jgi:hypothetical protein
VKLLQTFAAQTEALQRYRGKGQQKVTVEHVHVHTGGQAIVGSVSQSGGGRANDENRGQPHAQIPKSARRRTANSAERTLTAVMAVPHPGLWEKSAASIGSNGSAPSGDFSEIEATIHRL